MRSIRNVSPGFVTSTSAARMHGSSLRELGAPLDQERAASMADEGGVAGAVTDALAQTFTRPHHVSSLATRAVRQRFQSVLPWAMLLTGFVIVAVAWRRRY